MKYCPNCGCELKDETLTCCIECGEELPIVKKKKKRKRKQKKSIDHENQNDFYDGYYDDRIPVDAEQHNEEIDKILIRNIIIVLLCVLFIISICVAVLLLL